MNENEKRLQHQRRMYLLKLMTSAGGEDIDLDTYNFHRVYVIFGFTGSGKDAVTEEFMKRNKKFPFAKFVRTLTRAKRPGENEIFSAYFVEKELFNHLKERGRFFYHYEKYDGNEFGYDTSHLIFLLSNSNIIMVGGGEQNLPGLLKGIKSVFPSIPITTVFVNRPKKDIQDSIRKRGGDPAQIEKRIQYVEENWRDRPLDNFDYFIWAENLEEGIAEFTRIVEETLTPPSA
ncbi:hypothetical protein JXD20_01840 [Candidatus Peregrinibacteria bacterium]|nr:hypothetical protein [Candidatus Peregrinibacteria bacterium]